jgi:putative ABC transport system substrate-binding protein
MGRRVTTRLAAIGLAAALLAVGCGSDDAVESRPDATVAFLRAVAGAPSTEPSFVASLRSAGYVEGDNLTLLAADADEAYADPDAAAAAVAGWVEQGVDLIVALSSSGAMVAAETAPDVDVLFLSTDPTATGLVEDEDEPEGRLTGVSFRVPADRTLSLAQRAVPGLDSVGLAYPPSDPAALANRDAVVAAADDLGIALLLAEFTDATDVAAAVEELAAAGADAILVSTSPVATRALAETGTAAARLRLPVIANTTLADFALVSLTADTAEIGRQLGRQAARLLSGESPATVPVEDPNRFLLTLGGGAARTLGLVLDAGLLREADEVTG